VRAGDRLRLGATIAFEFGPESAEGEQRAVIIEREPDDVLLLGLWVRLRRILRKAICWDKATALRFEPAPLTRASIPLDAIRRQRNTPIWKLEAALKCRSCRKGRYAPPVHMIKLT
jgi:hypothetical protein